MHSSLAAEQPSIPGNKLPLASADEKAVPGLFPCGSHGAFGHSSPDRLAPLAVPGQGIPWTAERVVAMFFALLSSRRSLQAKPFATLFFHHMKSEGSERTSSSPFHSSPPAPLLTCRSGGEEERECANQAKESTKGC